MATNTLADFVYDPQIKSQPLAILALLSKTELHQSFVDWDAKFKRYRFEKTTAPWYNGRETGFSLVVCAGGTKPRLCIVCVEARRSDDIMVYSWEYNGSYLNPPTLSDFSDEIYHTHGRSFPYLGIKEAYEYIVGRIKDHLRTNKE